MVGAGRKPHAYEDHATRALSDDDSFPGRPRTRWLITAPRSTPTSLRYFPSCIGNTDQNRTEPILSNQIVNAANQARLKHSLESEESHRGLDPPWSRWS